MTVEPTPPARREPTPVDAVAERWVDTLVDLDPTVATWIGREGRTGEYGDYSPAGQERHEEAVRAALRDLDAAPAVDDVDLVTRDDLRSELVLDLEQAEHRLELRDLNVIASPAQGIREVLDLMPTDSDEEWSDVASRLAGVDRAVAQYVETLRLGMR
jgi:uncharacterized protein (DUF885 family)